MQQLVFAHCDLKGKAGVLFVILIVVISSNINSIVFSDLLSGQEVKSVTWVSQEADFLVSQGQLVLHQIKLDSVGFLWFWLHSLSTGVPLERVRLVVHINISLKIHNVNFLPEECLDFRVRFTVIPALLLPAVLEKHIYVLVTCILLKALHCCVLPSDAEDISINEVEVESSRVEALAPVVGNLVSVVAALLPTHLNQFTVICIVLLNTYPSADRAGDWEFSVYAEHNFILLKIQKIHLERFCFN